MGEFLLASDVCEYRHRHNKPNDWVNFKDQRTFVQKAMKKAHHDYLNNIFSEEGNKGMWRYIKNKKSGSSSVGILHSNGKTAIDPSEKANMLNEQFASVFSTDESTDSPDLGPSPHPPMPEIKISEVGVLALLKKLSPKGSRTLA